MHMPIGAELVGTGPGDIASEHINMVVELGSKVMKRPTFEILIGCKVRRGAENFFDRRSSNMKKVRRKPLNSH
jgi:hypothetical protein